MVDGPGLPTLIPGQRLVRESAIAGAPLSREDRAHLTRDELLSYATFFQLPEAERVSFNGAELLAYAATWRSRLSANEEAQLNRRQRDVYAQLIECGMVGHP
jgi:hypothetical protein